MAKYKIGDKLICILIEKNDIRKVGSGYKLGRVITVRNVIERDTDRTIYWPRESTDEIDKNLGIFEFALDYYIESTIDKEVLNDLLNSFDECLKTD